jgi:pilus assembly protein CpaF
MPSPNDPTEIGQSSATIDVPIEFSAPPRHVSPSAVAEIRHFPARDTQAIHEELLSQLHPERLIQARPEDKEEMRKAIINIIARRRMPYSGVERDQLAEQVLQEVYGYGPLQPLIDDETVDDILVNTHTTVYVERKGIIEETNVRFYNREHLMHIIDRIVSAVGRHVDESSPMVDARLSNGSRVNIIIPPLALDGPIISIRKFGVRPLTAENLVASKSITPEMLEFLKAAVKAKLSCLISGGTGAGKTTLLNVLSRSIGPRERIITVEDSAELKLQQKHVVRLECRPANVEGRGQIRQRELVVNALRMRPDRIVLGEVRGEEALDLLQAMNTGHDGSLATIHANSPRDAITRLESMVLMGSTNLPEKAIKQQIANAIHLIIQASRLSDGRRCITNITELSGMQGDVLTTQEIFAFEKSGVDSQGRVHGAFRGMGLRPRCLEIITTAGGALSRDIFDHRMEV